MQLITSKYASKTPVMSGKRMGFVNCGAVETQLDLATHYRAHFITSSNLWRPKLPGSAHAGRIEVRKIEQFDRKTKGVGCRR